MEEKLSSSLFLPGGGFFDNYVTACGQNEILFLPDLASAHYTLPTQALFDELHIPYVPQEAKPSISHQTPPSGGIFGILKGLVCKDARKPKLSTSSSSG